MSARKNTPATLVALIALVVPAILRAQSEPAPQPPAEPAQPSVPGPTFDPDEDISLADWEADDWLLATPKLAMFDLDGYFRLRGDLFQALDFRNRSTRYPLAEGDATAPAANFTGGNIRLRLEPTINITENIHLVATFDILDNLILGSTPDSIPPRAGQAAQNLISRGQMPPIQGYNSVMDGIHVKRVYARITALNEQVELRFGRMPNHFGLGMLANAGDCLDCDWGDVVDRAALSFKAAGHVFTPMFDWISNGPQIEPFGRAGGQPLDAVDWDDVEQYSVRVTRIDHPDDIQDALRNDDWVLNYGAWLIWRRQSRDLGAGYYQTPGPSGDLETTYDPTRPIDITNEYVENRNANFITTDVFAQFYWKTFRAALEAAFIWGQFSDRRIQTPEEAAAGTAPPERQTEALMWGLALELGYRLAGDYSGVEILLNAGAASGDGAPGFGAFDQADTQRGVFQDRIDTSLNNFQFSPNYHVDLLMFRRIIGTVTDAWYISPGVSYDFNEDINIRGNVTYSQAIFKRSTPSAACQNDPTASRCNRSEPINPAREMGVEIDAQASYGLYKDPGGNALRAAVQGGVLFPLNAFSNPLRPDDNTGPQVAWTIQGRLYLTF